MMDELENSDRLLQLVSEALRAGPGSSQWREAMELVRDGPEADELARLQQVRERLQAGKKWRQVRPGTGFTRRVMEAVDQQIDARARSTGPATIIAILSGLVVLIVIAILIPMLFFRAHPPAATSDELSHVYFSTPWIQSNFESALGGEWKSIGSLPTRIDHGIHPVQSASGKPAGWGIVSVQSLPANQFFSFAATLDVPVDGAVGQIFVTDNPNFEAERGTTGHELAVGADQKTLRIMLPGGQLATAVARNSEQTIQMSVLVGPRMAAVEVDGHQIWSGANELSADLPRYLGVRFLTHDHLGSAAIIKSVTVMKGRLQTPR